MRGRADARPSGAEASQPTEVVHVRQGFDVYIGRAMPGFEASDFANPFRIGRDGSRDEVIDKYERYIVERLSREPGLKAALQRLRGKRLGCWCKPARCHGDVLKHLLGDKPAEDHQGRLF